MRFRASRAEIEWLLEKASRRIAWRLRARSGTWQGQVFGGIAMGNLDWRDLTASLGGCPAASGAQKLPRAASVRISLSSDRSGTARLSLSSCAGSRGPLAFTGSRLKARQLLQPIHAVPRGGCGTTPLPTTSRTQMSIPMPIASALRTRASSSSNAVGGY